MKCPICNVGGGGHMVNCPKRAGHSVKAGTWEHAVAKLSERVDEVQRQVECLGAGVTDLFDSRTEPVNGQDVKPVECIVCGRTSVNMVRIPPTSWIVRGPLICADCVGLIKTDRSLAIA